MKATSYLRLALIATLSLLALYVVALKWCVWTNDQGAPCFGEFRPFVDYLYKYAFNPNNRRLLYYTAIFKWVGGGLLLLSLISFATKRWKTGIISLIIALGATGEAFTLLNAPLWAVSAATCGAAVGIFALLSFLPGTTSTELNDVRPPRKWEGMAFILFAVLFTFTHFYLMNRVPAGWDTESCGFRYFFHSSWAGVMGHEAGVHPQTTMGFSWMIAYWLMGHVDEPDNYFLYMRFLSTAITTLKFLAMFLFLRAFTGNFAAFLGIAFLGFGPPEDWWSREPSLHQIPGLLAILIIWASARALQHRRYRDFALLTVLDGCARFVYPSGLFFGFMPLTFFGLLLVFRWSEWKQHFFKLCLLPFGAIFWFGWRTLARAMVNGVWIWLSPLEIPGHAALPTSLGEKLYTIFVVNGLDVLKSIFVTQVNPTHWTVALTFYPHRSVTSVALVLFLIGVVRFLRGKSGAVGLLLILSLLWSFFPGLMTIPADRRIGVAFAVVSIIAAREAAYLLAIVERDRARWLAKATQFVLAPTLALYYAWEGSVMHFHEEGSTPLQVIRGQLLREFVEDDALMVYLTGDGMCEVFSAVYADVRARNCRTGWVHATWERAPEVQKLIDNPSVIPDSPLYKDSDLKNCTYPPDKKWNRVIYLFLDTSPTPGRIEELKVRYPQGELQTKERMTENGHKVRVFAYQVNMP